MGGAFRAHGSDGARLRSRAGSLVAVYVARIYSGACSAGLLLGIVDGDWGLENCPGIGRVGALCGLLSGRGEVFLIWLHAFGVEKLFKTGKRRITRGTCKI